MSEAANKGKTAAAQAKAAASNSTGAIEAAAGETVGRIDVKKVSGGLGNVGQGFLALSISLYAAAWAYAKFRMAGEQSYTDAP